MLSSTCQPPSGTGAHHDVGDDRLDGQVAEGAAGLGIERTQFRDHVGEIVLVDVAELAQSGVFAPRHQIEMIDQTDHAGVETVALLELDGEAFGKIAGADARRVEGLHQGQRALDQIERRIEALGDIGKVGAQIAGFVDLVDEHAADQPHGGIGGGQAELVLEVIGQRLLLGDEGFEIVVLGADRLARRGLGPALGGQRRRGLAGRLAVIVGKDIGEVGIEPRGDRFGIDLHARLHPVGRVVAEIGPGIAGAAVGLRLAGGLGAFAALLALDPFQERIALELGIDIGDEVEIGELEQLDRLHQLRRHHQRLALAELKLVRKCHYARLPHPESWSGNCLSSFGSVTGGRIKG